VRGFGGSRVSEEVAQVHEMWTQLFCMVWLGLGLCCATGFCVLSCCYVWRWGCEAGGYGV